ncbi:MAG: hypothetical protein N2053_00070 [Chitinispirillaceae bacterium]|nr:hypothetical protein [Chitinispirillaceae bacterium]
MPEHFDGLIMFSGGLDSTIAAHLLKSMGLSMLGIHFVLPFYSGLGYNHKKIKNYAEQLNLPLIIEEEGEEFLPIVKNPQFGFGKNVNPCMDCRIRRLKRARELMEEYGAKFIATGEVIGQRLKSQRLSCLHVIEKRANLKGKLLRPLSAGLLPPTIVEQEGLVDRSKLLSLSGRSREFQLQYAQKYGLKFSSPAGGCILTDVNIAKRYRILAEQFPDFNLCDFKLIAYGRHFLIDNKCIFIMGRDEYENKIIEKLTDDNDIFISLSEQTGPIGLCRGNFAQPQFTLAGSILAKYSKARDETEVKIEVYNKKQTLSTFVVSPLSLQECERYRI